MPKGKRPAQRRRFKRMKKMKRLRNRANLGTTVARFAGHNPFSRRYITKLNYSDIFNISGGATLRSVDRVFSLNSVYDPDVTGTGHQPRYYDQFSAIYGTYRVTGCKIKARYLPSDGTSPQQNHYLAVIPTADPSNLNNTTYLNVNEAPYAKTTMNNIYGRRSEISAYHPVHRIAGVAPNVVKYEDSFASQSSANPLTRLYWHVVAGTLDESNTSISGRLIVDLTYYVQWEDPIYPSAS